METNNIFHLINNLMDSIVTRYKVKKEDISIQMIDNNIEIFVVESDGSHNYLNHLETIENKNSLQ